MRRFLVVTLSFAGLILMGLLGRGAPATAAGPTGVCGSLATSTWTLAGSPYVVCASGATVPATATLTVQPGVTVQFSSTASLQVAGTLNAFGTFTQSVTFTGVTASAGSWHGLLVDHTALAPASANLAYTAFDFGGVAGSGSAEIVVDHGSLTLTHSLVRHSLGSGLDATTNARLSVDSTQFVSNGQDAVRLHDPVHDLPLTNLTTSGNLANVVHIQGLNTNLVGNLHWSNPGLPYVIDAIMRNNPGDQLTIEPGTEMRFASNTGLAIGGTLAANGAPGQPITFTAQTKAPGMWRGLAADGGSYQAAVQLSYATVEYGGSDVAGGNIAVNDGTVSVHHSVIRFSAKDGVHFGSNAGGSILSSQILSNSQVLTTTTYAVFNGSPTHNGIPIRAVLATNDWWGDPLGPQSDTPSCSTGHGGRVSAGVVFRPVLTSTNTSAEFPLSSAAQLTLAPRRWFAPGDGLAQVFFDISLRDGNGTPLPGRSVFLNASGAAIHDGGITDAAGHTLAFITASTSSDAGLDVDVSATLSGTACEIALSPVSRIHFTKPVNITDLFPDSPAPYVSYDLGISPLPLEANISATLSSKLTNPLSVPITVDVQFGIAQSGVGLTFGPIASFNGQVIPPHGTVTFQTGWAPPVAGHYCIQVSASIVGVGGALGPLAPASGPQMKQWNEQVGPGPTSPPSSKDSLNKADKAIKKVEKLPGGAGPIQQGIFDRGWEWMKDTAKKIDQALGGDPPRQDYTTISLPISPTLPMVQPSTSIPVARANALNAVNIALVNVVAYGNAAAIALDRYGGAAQAKDLTWEAQQANAQQYYQQQMGSALLTYADKLDAFVSLLQSENVTDTQVSVADVIAFQTRLNQPGLTGFTSQELIDAHNAGMTDDDLTAYKLELIATNPNDIADDLLVSYSSEAAVSRDLGNALLHPYNYAPGFTVGGSAGLEPSAAASGNTMVQLYNSTSTIQVSNTFTTPMAIIPRRVDLPADWTVTVSPVQVAPGTQTTVTVTILAGSTIPQGSLPQVGVEGYVGNTLVGGVLVDVAAPNYVLFDGHLRLYLPIVRH